MGSGGAQRRITALRHRMNCCASIVSPAILSVRDRRAMATRHSWTRRSARSRKATWKVLEPGDTFVFLGGQVWKPVGVTGLSTCWCTPPGDKTPAMPSWERLRKFAALDLPRHRGPPLDGATARTRACCPTIHPANSWRSSATVLPDHPVRRRDAARDVPALPSPLPWSPIRSRGVAGEDHAGHAARPAGWSASSASAWPLGFVQERLMR